MPFFAQALLILSVQSCRLFAFQRPPQLAAPPHLGSGFDPGCGRGQGSAARQQLPRFPFARSRGAALLPDFRQFVLLIFFRVLFPGEAFLTLYTLSQIAQGCLPSCTRRRRRSGTFATRRGVCQARFRCQGRSRTVCWTRMPRELWSRCPKPTQTPYFHRAVVTWRVSWGVVSRVVQQRVCLSLRVSRPAWCLTAKRLLHTWCRGLLGEQCCFWASMTLYAVVADRVHECLPQVLALARACKAKQAPTSECT